MIFAGLNYFAVVVAAIGSFMFGGLWYNALAKPWLAATGRTEAAIPENQSALPLAVAFVSQLVMAYVLANLIGHMGRELTVKLGLLAASFVWLGFVATTLATNHAFQGQKRALTLIDAGHWLGVLLIQGAIIGWLGIF